MELKPIRPINADNQTNEISFHLAPDLANDNWMKSARLLRQGRKAEETQLYSLIPNKCQTKPNKDQ